MNTYRLSQNWNPGFLFFKPMFTALLTDQGFPNQTFAYQRCNFCHIKLTI